MLTDGSGTILLDGNYDLTFRLWDAASGGTLLYTEAHTFANSNPVFVSKGGFSVLLGSLTPLPAPFNKPLYLGVSIGLDPELFPRTPLSSAPYAMGLRVPFELGNGPSPEIVCYPTVGGTFFDLLPPGAGGLNIALEPDGDGLGGGFLSVTRNTTMDAFVVDGNAGGTGNPTVSMHGAVQNVVFDLSQGSNACVQLPGAAISAFEIGDEPGISQDRFVGTRTIAAGAFNDNVSTLLNVPASGFVVVEGTGQHVYGGTNNSQNWADFWISIGASATDVDPNYAVRSGITSYSGTPALPTLSEVVSVHRTFFLTPGQYTFHFESKGQSVGGGTNQMVNPTITATYYPTSYGPVTALVSGAELSSFAKATPVAGTRAALVDLRELELRAAKAEADAQSARRAVLEARLLEQSRARQAARGAVKR